MPGRSILRGLLAVALALIVGGCDRLAPRAEPRAKDALWIAAESAPLDRHQLDALEGVGVEELFVEAATLDWRGAEPMTSAVELPRLPPRSPVTLVTRGGWPADEPAIGEAVGVLTTALRSLQLEAEAAGAVVSGHHLDLQVETSRLDEYRRLLERLRRALDRDLLLSAEVAAGWLEREEIAPVVAAVDFFTVQAFGQPPEEPDRAGLWELEAALEVSRRADRLGRPYRTRVGIVGRAVRTSGRGEPVAMLRGLPMAELVASEAVVIEPTFNFEGFHRETFTVAARGPSTTLGVPLAVGEALQVSRPTVYHLAALERALEEAGYRHRLGSLYVRLPGPRETLSLGARDLVHALSPGPPPSPELQPWGEVGSRGGSWRVTAGIVNPSELATAVAVVDSNYLEIRLDDAVFGSVDLGDFRRMELRRSDRDTFDMRTLRNADVLRLYYPLLEPGWHVESGTIVVRPSGRAPAIRVGARFQLADGRTVELEPLPLEQRSRPRSPEEER